MDFKVGKWKLSLGTPTIGEPKAGEKTVKMYWVFNHGKRATTYPISEETKNELVKKRLGAGISFMPIKVPESQYKKYVKADINNMVQKAYPEGNPPLIDAVLESPERGREELERYTKL